MAVFKVMGVDNDLWLVTLIHQFHRLSVGLDGCLLNRVLSEDEPIVIIASET
jgi:hypothetical protein